MMPARPLADRCRRRGVSKPLHADRRAATALEFALVAPVFLLFLFSILGAGLGGFYQMLLDDSVRVAARQLQIAGPASTSGASFVTAVCNEFSVLAINCTGTLTYAVQANVPPAGFASLTPVVLPASGKLSNSFPSSLPANSNVLVQVSYPLPFPLPFVGVTLTRTGTSSILSTTTVRMEPYG